MNAHIPAVIKLNNTSKSFGKSRALEEVNLEVKAGEIFGFLGPNGAGKSTAINIMLDIIRPSGGSVELFGETNRGNTAKLRRRIGYVAGDMELYSHWTGGQFVRLAGSLSGDWSLKRTHEVAKRLNADLNKKIGSLSRGNKQKIGLVAVFARSTELLILDEPSSGLDPLIQQEFNKLVLEYRRDGGTVFISSHVLDEVQALCDRVAFIREGKIIAAGNLKDIIGKIHKRVTIRGSTELLRSIAARGIIKGLVIRGGAAHFEVRGSVGKILALLPLSRIDDMTVTPPSLEEIFLRYYGLRNGEEQG